MFSIALKEWSAVCHALTLGRQVVLLRKGGVAESAGEFRVVHPRFWLYPTHQHQQEQGVVPEAAAWVGGTASGDAEARQVPLSAWAEVLDTLHLESEEAALRLAPFHFWTEATIRKRFAYRKPGLQALLVRVHVMAAPHSVTESAKYLGCRSWVELDTELLTAGSRPVLDEAALQAVVDAIRARLR